MRPALFLHIPKTAGTTLNAVLAANYPPEATVRVYDRESAAAFEGMDEQAYSRLQLVQGHLFVADFHVLTSRFGVFTFLRDPVERVISEYEFLMRWPEHHLYEFMTREGVTLRDYAAGERPEFARRARNLMTHSLCGVAAETPEARLEAALENLFERFVCFGTVARFDESLVLLRQALGLEHILYEPQNVRVRRAAPDRPQPTAEDKAFIRERNALDMALYAAAVTELDRRMEARGREFAKAVARFKALNTRYQAMAAQVMAREGADEVRHGLLRPK